MNSFVLERLKYTHVGFRVFSILENTPVYSLLKKLDKRSSLQLLWFGRKRSWVKRNVENKPSLGRTGDINILMLWQCPRGSNPVRPQGLPRDVLRRLGHQYEDTTLLFTYLPLLLLYPFRLEAFTPAFLRLDISAWQGTRWRAWPQVGSWMIYIESGFN